MSANTQLYTGVAVLLGGILFLSGGLEVIAVVGGALMMVTAQQKKRRGDRDKD